MNKAYRQGYNEGLAAGRMPHYPPNEKLNDTSLRVLLNVLYGTQNKAAANSMKAGFRAGYAVGWDAQQIEIGK